MASAYIVPSVLLTTSPPGREWHAAPIPADPTQSLVVVKWDEPGAEADFESLPGVLPLGAPWELLPDSAAPLLASFQGPGTKNAPLAMPAIGAPVVPDSVATAFRKVSWPGARLAR